MKPLLCIVNTNSSKSGSGGLVYFCILKKNCWKKPDLDPMCGSGTTCKMAKLNNRRYVGIHISEEYCKVIQERLRTIHSPHN